MVDVVGRVTSVEQTATKTVYILDDKTGTRWFLKNTPFCIKNYILYQSVWIFVNHRYYRCDSLARCGCGR